MVTSNDAARKRLGLILRDILARLKAEHDPHRTGAILTRATEAGKLARALGYDRVPIAVEEKLLRWSDPTGDAGGATARLPDGRIASTRGKAVIVRALKGWCREVAIREHGEPVSVEPKPKPKGLLPCYQRARDSFLWALRERADLSDDDGDGVALQKVYNAIQAGGCPAYSKGAKVPGFDTWVTYLRKAREKLNSPRTAREHGRSIVPADEI